MIFVEIGNDWVKVLQAEPSRRGLVVTRLHLEPFKPSASGLSESLAAALRQQKFGRFPAIGCLPRQMVNVRILELPSTDSEEIADMVDLQAGKQTPYSKDEIVADYRIIGSTRQGYTRVMLAIIQRNVLRERYYLLEEAGLDVQRMSVSTEGVLNWYLHAAARTGTETGTLALLDIDSFYADFIIIADRQLAFTRSILIGANQLLEDYGKWKDKLMREARRSVEMFQSESASSAPARLLLTGAGARIKGLADDLSAELKLPAQAVDCRDDVQRLPSSPSLNDAAYAPVSMTPLVGMALDPEKLEFKLIPDSVRARKELSAKSRGLSLLAILAMAVLVSLSAVVTSDLYLKKDYRDLLSREHERTQPAVERVQHMRQIVNVVNARRDASLSTIKILLELRKLVPTGLFFDSIDIDQQTRRLSLSGTTDDRKGIRALVVNLEQSPLFAEAEQNQETQERNGRLRFQVNCAMEKRP